MLSLGNQAISHNLTTIKEVNHMKQAMSEPLKQISCDPQCGFMVRSHDERELKDIARAHVKKMHNMDISDADLASKIKSA